ncbi:type IV fimbrial biogenesis protein FimT [Luteimonas cucumeris]|uniref:Type II secretion system protein H n=1 Tax=Luteimonas cucumeris TaxID=985012 RepID=A0A562KXU8_9GAMM|nr:GspH/FimT family pseudopilin [Luteimonas cucumeris]TWI00215.1 type IV fimbrial biogenesis protein FimT [Luteimonas cucumeris]
MYSIRTKGFSLVELMTVVAIVAILAAIAFPSFHSTLQSNRVATTTNELIASMSLARTEAIRSRERGSVCTSADGATCGGDWNSGWLVWSDLDSNGAVNGTETVVRYVQGHQKLTVTGSANLLAFDGRGRIVGGAQSVGVHPDDAATPIRCVLIGPTGQTRTTQAACQ